NPDHERGRAVSAGEPFDTTGNGSRNISVCGAGGFAREGSLKGGNSVFRETPTCANSTTVWFSCLLIMASYHHQLVQFIFRRQKKMIVSQRYRLGEKCC